MDTVPRAMRHVRRTAPLRAALRAPTLRGLTSRLALGAPLVGVARTAPEAASCLWQPRRGAKRKAKGKRGGKQRQQRQEQGQVTEPEADADGDELEDFSLDESELKMEAALEYLESRFAALQTGRAAPALVEGVSVLAYEGAPAIPLPQLGTITVRDP